MILIFFLTCYFNEKYFGLTTRDLLQSILLLQTAVLILLLLTENDYV